MKKPLSEHLIDILSRLPDNPGVYQMKNDKNEVIYVGKAKSLKNRVKSYFLRTEDLSVAKRQMVEKIADIELITCDTEVEALILETNLIKHISPKYNILMKDDKDLAYIKITKSPVPELVKTRQRLNDGWEYFWPFPAWVEASVRDLRKIFRIRNCRIRFEGDERNIYITDKAGKTIPCMDYYIWICPWPCLLKEKNISDHSNNLQSARSFLSWNGGEVFGNLELQMRNKAKNLEFEDAQKIKDTISLLRSLYEKQSVRDLIQWNIDAFSIYEKYDNTYLWIMQIRSGQIVAVSRYSIKSHEDIDDAAAMLFVERYSLSENLPESLVMTDKIKDDSLVEFLSQKNITLEFPKIWSKKNVLDFLQKQLMDFAYRSESKSLEMKTFSRIHMKNILVQLGYPVPKKWPIVFECYDISHTDGHFTYASRVVIEDGKPNPSKYKKYKIKTLLDGEIDDFASHKEVMTRRIIEVIERNNMPQLIIIDGGKWQLSSAIHWIQKGIDLLQKGQDIDIHTIPICSIAKREEEIFLPRKKESIHLEPGTPELMVLQKARDESHKFSINANKSSRMKSMKKNILESIPWIWPTTRKNLLRMVHGVDDIKNIPLEEILKIITKKQLQALQDHWIYPCIY